MVCVHCWDILTSEKFALSLAFNRLSLVHIAGLHNILSSGCYWMFRCPISGQYK